MKTISLTQHEFDRKNSDMSQYKIQLIANTKIKEDIL